MALVNPNIALSVKPVEIPQNNMLDAYSKIIAIQNAQNQNAMAQYQLGAAQREEAAQNALSEAYKAAYNPETGAYDMNKLRGAVISGGAGARLPDIEKKIGEMKTQQLAQGKAESELIDKRLKLSKEGLNTVRTPEEYIAWHEANHKDPILGPYLASRGVTPESSRANIISKLQEPGGFQQLLLGSALGLEKLAEQHFAQQNTGSITRTLAMPKYALPGMPSAATVVPGSTAQMKATPGELLTDARARERIELSPEGSAAVSKAILEGRLDPNKVNSRNVKIIASTLMAKPDANLRGLSLEATTETASARTLGNISANVVTASNEAEKMIPIAQSYISKIAPSDYPVLNKTGLFVAKQTGDPNQAGLAASLNALVNTYARAINPRGVPTVSDKNHAREVINTAMSQGQFAEVFNVMQQEMAASQAAPKEARPKLFGGESKEKEKAPASAGAASVTLPDGRTMNFPNAAAAAEFKKSAGL